MLLSLNGRRVYFDHRARPTAPVSCFTHSLIPTAARLVEQMVPLLGAGYLRAAARHARPWRQRRGGG